MFSVIIVAAGSSRRMGQDKLMMQLLGRPVLEHTIRAFSNIQKVNEIIVVCPEERFRSIDIETTLPIRRVDGGANRHDSVSNGLSALSPHAQWVAVHDGARPLVQPRCILNVLEAAKKHRAATAARRVTETVKRANEQSFIQQSVSRDHLWLMETPQVFQKDLLLKAYDTVHQSGATVTDEVSALEMIDIATYLVTNSTPNPKVTYPEDITLAEILLKAQQQA